MKLIKDVKLKKLLRQLFRLLQRDEQVVVARPNSLNSMFYLHVGLFARSYCLRSTLVTSCVTFDHSAKSLVHQFWPWRKHTYGSEFVSGLKQRSIGDRYLRVSDLTFEI